MMQRSELIRWLLESNESDLETLWKRADEVRRRSVGDAVHLRGLIEISNYCIRECHYCGLRVNNMAITRYRMTDEEVLSCARQAKQFGYGTVVLQSGEDPQMTLDWIASLIRQIKTETHLAVTLSLGERSMEELDAWRNAGADRYLLRFETSNPVLFSRIHPPKKGSSHPNDRVDLLKQLHRFGYEVGSGVMVGIPGQTYSDLANDLELFRELDLDMIGLGPYLPHPETPLGKTALEVSPGHHEQSGGQPNEPPMEHEHGQVPASELMTYKMLALTRMVCPKANIPSTTALATMNLAQGRELGLQRGANIVMPNLTPSKYRIHYEIYPSKACIRETADQCHTCMNTRIRSIGRSVGTGPGHARSNMQQNEPADD